MVKWEFRADSFEPDEVRNAFRVLGFAVIRQVLDQQEVAAVRAYLDQAFAGDRLKQLQTMPTGELLQHEPIWRCLFKEGVVRPLRAALGPQLCYQHDMDVQRNSYGQAGLRRHLGWHMDAGSESRHAYLRSAGYRFAKCGIYLQNADNGWGGGIRVKPKSHRRFGEPNALKRNLFLLRRISNRVAIQLRLDLDTIEVPTQAGDLCFFDSRLLHSSVLPSRANIARLGYDRKPDVGSFWADIPQPHTKYVIYWDACNRAMVEDFLRNSVQRSEVEPKGMQEQPSRMAVYSRILSMRYPQDFPPDFVAAATGVDVGVASLGAEEAVLYKSKLQTMSLLETGTG